MLQRIPRIFSISQIKRRIFCSSFQYPDLTAGNLQYCQLCSIKIQVKVTGTKTFVVKYDLYLDKRVVKTILIPHIALARAERVLNRYKESRDGEDRVEYLKSLLSNK